VLSCQTVVTVVVCRCVVIVVLCCVASAADVTNIVVGATDVGTVVVVAAVDGITWKNTPDFHYQALWTRKRLYDQLYKLVV
jgi:hypothetical protein